MRAHECLPYAPPGRCDAEVWDRSGRWKRCGEVAQWFWPTLHWECCDKHCRYEFPKKRGQLVDGVIPLGGRERHESPIS
jgi:hypothetical protein